MVQLSSTVALALMASSVSAIPFSDFFKAAFAHKRGDNWFTVFNYDPSSTAPDNARTQQLFVTVDSCTTLENMWDKETSFITVGAGLVCEYFSTENCDFENRADYTDDNYVALGGNPLKESGPYDLTKVSGLKDRISSYLCKTVSAPQVPQNATSTPAPTVKV